MVPSGFKECIPRRYERMLRGMESLSSQDGTGEEAARNQEIFQGMMCRPMKLVAGPSKRILPEWHVLTVYVYGADMPEAPQYEHKTTGELVRVIPYKKHKSLSASPVWRSKILIHIKSRSVNATGFSCGIMWLVNSLLRLSGIRSDLSALLFIRQCRSWPRFPSSGVIGHGPLVK